MVRDLEELVRCISVTQRELTYQVHRIRSGLAQPSSVLEQEALFKTADEYEAAAKILGKLWGYQKGRLERQQAGDGKREERDGRARGVAGVGRAIDEVSE